MVKNYLKQKLNQDVELLETLFDLGDQDPLVYLGKSIEYMAFADIVVIYGNWENYRGCIIERECALRYSKEIIYIKEDEINGLL